MGDITTALTAFLMHVGARSINFDMTDAQKKLMTYPLAKACVLFAMFFITTRKFTIALLLVIGYFMITMVLLNENHKYNLYSRSWLKQHGFTDAKDNTFSADTYTQNVRALT
jgi:hypothetical protein